MLSRSPGAMWRVLVLILLCVGTAPVLAQSTGSMSPHAQGSPMRATGTFDVKLTPETAADNALGRMLIDKQFHGDLVAGSKGEMIAAMTGVEGSAGYVALERVTGTLQGRKGSFVLQHSGTMNRGTPSLSITVVPDSGTEDLAGLSGTMTIIIEGPKHSYDFSYSIAAP